MDYCKRLLTRCKFISTVVPLREFVAVCREWPSTYVTDVVVEKADYSDPMFPPNIQVEQRDDKPHGNALVEPVVSPTYDDDDGGVSA